MIEVSPDIRIDEREIEETFIRASGPGGQKVNKTATAVQLRFDAMNSPSLPEEVRERLRKLAGSRLTNEGVLVIEAREYRTQELNREAARQRLIELIRRATRKPKTRKKTRPSKAAQQRRLEKKRQRGEIKRMRRSIPPSGHE